MLSSGIFTAILKSLQFTGIFKEEISKVMVGTDFIKNRNDLPELWKEEFLKRFIIENFQK